MVYGDRNYNQEAIAHLNSTSPLNFPTEDISAEDLARDLDLFTNTQFFDFDFGGGPSFASLDSGEKQVDNEPRDGSTPHLGSVPGDSSLHTFSFLTEPLSFDLNALGGGDDESSAKRRKMDSEAPEATPGSSEPLDEAARAAAEEDKRRRNTLASARFRQKKKMREQALEKDHKDMSAKIEKMENRIKELELENKWLRGLVVQNKP